MAAIFDARFTKTIAFDSTRHPSAVLFADLIVQILERMPGLIDARDLPSWYRRIAGSRGIGTAYDHPVALPFAAALGCEWIETVPYRRWAEAETHFAGENWQAALSTLDDARAHAGSHPDFFRMIEPFHHYRRAVCLYRTGERDVAHLVFEEAVRCRSITAEPALRAEFARAIGDHETAIRYWKAAALEVPEKVSFSVHLARSYLDAGLIDDALRALAGIDRERRTMAAWEAIGFAHVQAALSHLTEARAAYAEVRPAKLQPLVARLNSRIDEAIAAASEEFRFDLSADRQLKQE